jgi:DNA-binding PadR family transcriptional regulator
MPRHGYQLEQLIEQRGMREWTQIGFSSIYFVLGKLEQFGLISAKQSVGAKAKKVFSVTRAGRRALSAQTYAALRDYRPTYSSLLLGMIHWPVLTRDEALQALKTRGAAIEAELTRLDDIRADKQPLPDFIEAVFDFSLGQLRAEAEWVAHTLDYMRTKPWLT